MSSVSIAVGERVRSLRVAAGKSRDELAEAAGTSLNFLGRIERGLQNVNLSTLVRLAMALDVRLEDLVGGLDLPALVAEDASILEGRARPAGRPAD